MNQKSNFNGNNATQVPSAFESAAGGQSAFGGGGNSQFGGAGGAGGGEFGATNFGATNAVSQIFKEGGFGDEGRKKALIISAAVAALLLCGGAVWWLFSSGDKTHQPETAATEETEGEEEAAEEAAPATAAAPAAQAPAAPSGAVADSNSHAYDERNGPIIINVTPGAHVVVSRTASFASTYIAGTAKNGQFRIPLPPPGKVFWKDTANNAVHEITVTPPPHLGLNFSAPQQLAAGTEISWSASGPVSHYRIEFSADNKFTNLVKVFATQKTSAAIQDVTAGSYFVRVGGLNMASGKWEYSSPTSVKVQ